MATFSSMVDGTKIALVFSPLEQAFASLLRALESLPAFRQLETPEELAVMSGEVGGKALRLRTSRFASSEVDGRVVRVDGEGIWILNAVVWPQDSASVPILGLEVLAFRDKLHLLVADLFPVSDRDVGLMDQIGPRFDLLGESPEMPGWASRIFSRRPIFRKPGSSDAIQPAACAIELVVDAWMSRLRAPDNTVTSDIVAEAAKRRDDYLRAHRADEPANPFLKKAFGEVLGGRLVNEVLFPDPDSPKGQSQALRVSGIRSVA